MRRILPVLLPLVLITACDADVVAPPSSGATVQLRASFPVGGVIDTIVVDAVDRLPLRAVELVAPDGGATPANYINVIDAPRFVTGQRVMSDPWRNALVGGTGAAAPLAGNTDAAAALQGQSQLLATVSTADILLPDAVVYRRDWARYRIRLSFGTPPDLETREIAAPEPPPQPSPPL